MHPSTREHTHLKVSPRTQPEAFVLLVETWLLWMQPWTAPSQLKASAAAAANAPSTRGGAAPLPGSSSSSTGASRYANHHAAAYGPEWENWVLACEDVYTVPLLPFLQRMGSLDYGGSNKRDAQLKACESVMEVFKGPLLDVLRQSPTEALRRALEVAGSVQAPGDRYTGCSLAPLGQVCAWGRELRRVVFDYFFPFVLFLPWPLSFYFHVCLCVRSQPHYSRACTTTGGRVRARSGRKWGGS